MENSPGPRKQYQALLHLSVGASKGIQRNKDRLGQGGNRTIEEADHRQRSTQRDRDCAEPDFGPFKMRRKSARDRVVSSAALILLYLQLLNNEPENEITLTAFRLLTMDLLVLFHVMNEGTINVLGECADAKLHRRTLTSNRALL